MSVIGIAIAGVTIAVGFTFIGFTLITTSACIGASFVVANAGILSGRRSRTINGVHFTGNR